VPALSMPIRLASAPRPSAPEATWLGVAADRMIDRAVVHAGAAAGCIAASRGTRRRAWTSAIVEQHDVIFAGAVGIVAMRRGPVTASYDRHPCPVAERASTQKLRHIRASAPAFQRSRTMWALAASGCDRYHRI
jgi:hypothetical protein